MSDQQASSRRFVHARHGDTIATVAQRELPHQPDASQELLSWNLHLALRRSPSGLPGQLLGTDIVYLEPPR